MTIMRSSKPQRAALRASRACVQCRSQHAKCGAEMPVCGRCQQDGKPCYYVQSRRSATAKAKASSLPVSDGSNDGFPSPPLTAYSLSGQSSDCLPIRYEAMPIALPLEAVNGGACHGETEQACRNFIDAYYNHFHNAHPFLTPRHHFLRCMDTNIESVAHILPVVRYIGSLYMNDDSSTWLAETAVKQFDTPDLPLNGHTVLAFLLLAIAIYGQDDRTNARILLNRGIQMAIDIGMNQRAFASAETDPVWAESWRRTFWGFYVTDVIIADFWHETYLSGSESDVDFPSDDAALNQPRTLEQYEFRDFQDRVPIFSSFTYLIDLVKIAKSVSHLSCLHGEDLYNAVADADTKLIAWKLHLPPEKQAVVKGDGGVDHLLFHAHLLWQSLTVMIHRPLSILHRAQAIYEDTPLVSPTLITDDYHRQDACERLHTRRTFDAIAATMNLCTLPISIIQQSPLAINCVASSTITSMMEYQKMLPTSPQRPSRDKVRLGVAVLNQFAQVWPLAANTNARVKKMAREVLTLAQRSHISESEFLIDMSPFLDQSLVSAVEAWTKTCPVEADC